MDVRFSHFQFFGGWATAAYEVRLNVVRVAFAFCSPHDQFSRKRGRTIAEGRLRKGKFRRIAVVDGEDLVQVFLDCAESEMCKPGAYSRTHMPWWAIDEVQGRGFLPVREFCVADESSALP